MSQDKTRDKEFEKGRSYCLRLLSKRARTEKEISSRLGEKGYSEATIALLVKAFKDKGILNDARFADDWVRLRVDESPRSRNLLEAELKAKGVPENIVSASLASSNIPSERDLALRVIDSKAADDEPDEKEKARLFRLLVGKGFDVDIAEEVINERFN